jgi:5-hydroxyisourate hydrolase-like protein (transthyretin family)
MVSLAKQSHDSQIEIGRGRTDDGGHFTYTGGRPDLTDGETYYIEIDIDAYFATLGIISFHRKVIVSFRVLDSDECRIVSLITPSVQATCQIR